VLERLAELNMLEILQTKIVDRILKDIWASKIDVSGTIMDNSSCWTILRYGDLGFNEDFEYRHRFYVDRHGNRNTVRPHILTFRVWCESIKLRYFIEMIVYLALLFAFQYYVSNYNDDMHTLYEEIKEMNEHGTIARLLLKDKLLRVLTAAEEIAKSSSENCHRKHLRRNSFD